MKSYNFVYNYSFLSDWFHVNSDIKRNEFLEKMDMQDYNTLRNWIDGITMIPLTQMMKFCNKFNVPISAFFLNDGEELTLPIQSATPLSNIIPKDGYPEQTKRSGIKICDPRTNVHLITNLPDYIKIAEIDDSTSHTEREEVEVVRPAGADFAQNSMQERMRYISIIEKLTDQIVALTNENRSLQARLSDNTIIRNHFVAEDDVTKPDNPKNR